MDTTERPIRTAFRLLGGRWKPLIIWQLVEEGTLRNNELHKRIPEASQKMLVQQLRELEEDGIIERKVYSQVPPKVEYSITEYGKQTFPLLVQMYKWGREHQKSEHFPVELRADCDLNFDKILANIN